MNRVVKITVAKSLVAEQTLFRSAILKDCVRFIYLCKDKSDLVVLNKANEIVDLKEWIYGISGDCYSQSSISSNAYELG